MQYVLVTMGCGIWAAMMMRPVIECLKSGNLWHRKLSGKDGYVNFRDRPVLFSFYVALYIAFSLLPVAAFCLTNR